VATRFGDVGTPVRTAEAGFPKVRQVIREALRKNGIAGRIDQLVAERLDGL
jgi:hypothetical protein